MKNNLLFLLLSLFSSYTFSQVVINELDSDTQSTDVKEFVELKSDVPNFSLNGYVLVFFNGSSGAGKQSYLALDLDGLTTNVNGIVTIGNDLVSPVPHRYLQNSSIQNGPDGVGLYLGNGSNFPTGTVATNTNLIDALIHSNNNTTQATSLMAALGETLQLNENQNGLKDSESIQRKNDGTYEVKTPTPGSNNDGSGVAFNGIAININSVVYNEGDVFPITFTTQKAVTGSDLVFTFTLNNGTFTNSDFTGNTTVTIPVGAISFTTTITVIDDNLNEGDELLTINLGTIPSTYNRLNDAIDIRIIDNDFTIANWGNPLSPTYGIVSSTAPTNYYASLEGKSGAALKQAIQDIIANPSVVRVNPITVPVGYYVY